MAQTLHVIQGNTAEWEVPVVDQDGAAVDLSSATDLSFLVKTRISDDDVDAVMSYTPTVKDPATAGILEVRLSPALTGAVTEPDRWYVWGIQYKVGSQLYEFPDPTEDPGALYVRRGVVAATP